MKKNMRPDLWSRIRISRSYSGKSQVRTRLSATAVNCSLLPPTIFELPLSCPIIGFEQRDLPDQRRALKRKKERQLRANFGFLETRRSDRLQSSILLLVRSRIRQSPGAKGSKRERKREQAGTLRPEAPDCGRERGGSRCRSRMNATRSESCFASPRCGPIRTLLLESTATRVASSFSLEPFRRNSSRRSSRPAPRVSRLGSIPWASH